MRNMQQVNLVLSDSKGEQWGVFPFVTPFVPCQGEYIHYLSEESGNAVFRVLFVQYVVEAKGKGNNRGVGQLTHEPYIHVEISDDEEPWLTGTFRHFADGLKSAGVALHQRDKRGW